MFLYLDSVQIKILQILGKLFLEMKALTRKTD